MRKWPIEQKKIMNQLNCSKSWDFTTRIQLKVRGSRMQII